MGRGFFLLRRSTRSLHRLNIENSEAGCTPACHNSQSRIGCLQPTGWFHHQEIWLQQNKTAPNSCRATLRVLVAFPLCPESGFYYIAFFAEPAMVRQGYARAFLAFLQNRSCLAANLTIHGYEDAFNHCHVGLDAGSKPFDSLPASATGGGFRPHFPWLY
jgi:hypothetical protein